MLDNENKKLFYIKILFVLRGEFMDKKAIPNKTLVELKEQGYSDKMVKELCKWYDSSKHKGVASF